MFNSLIPVHLTNSLLCLKEMHSRAHDKAGAGRFMAPLFMTAPNGNKTHTHRHTMNKSLCVHTMDYYTPAKKSTLLLPMKIWIDLTDITLSKRSQ